MSNLNGHPISATQLRIPMIALEYDDWKPGELILIAFFYNIIYNVPIEHTDYSHEYVINDRDFLIIANLKGTVSDPDQYLANLRRIFRIGVKGGHYTVQWRPDLIQKKKWQPEISKMLTCNLVPLRHQKCTEIWYYLMGKFSSNNLFLDDDMTIEEVVDYYNTPLLSGVDASLLSLRIDLFPRTNRYKVKKTPLKGWL